MTYRNRALLDLARGAPCFGDMLAHASPETVVAAHQNAGKGIGHKVADHEIAFLCDACHRYVDGRSYGEKVQDDNREARRAFWIRAHFKSMAYLWERGLIQVTGTAQKRDKGYQRPSKVLPRCA